MSRPSRRRAAIAIAAVALAGCGRGTVQPITFDTGPAPTFPSTTSSPNVSVPLTTSPGLPSVTTSPGLPSVTTGAGGSGVPVGTAVPASSLVAPDAAWQNVTGSLSGLSSECGTISFVAGSPNADTVIAGIGAEGLWAAGPDDQWRALGTGAGSEAVDNRPFSILFDPQDPKRFWEAGGYHGGGVFTTTDGGSTFRQLGNLSHLQAVGVDLDDPARSTLLASAHESAGMWRSTDGGRQWEDITATGPPAGFIVGLAVLGPTTFLIGTSGASGGDNVDGVYRSTDSGATWTNAFPAPMVGNPLVSAVDGSIYWVLGQGKGVIRSTDDGVTWERVNAGAVLHPNVPTLAEMPNGAIIGVGRFSLVGSLDHGVTWQAFGPNLPFNDPASVTYAPLREAFYVARNDCDVTVPSQPITDGSVVRLDALPSA